VGIIGRNGAGKSTLLKILSPPGRKPLWAGGRITEPTAGRVHIKGRVASLLEVGTGFHPELTGHENVFLNGASGLDALRAGSAILGMSRAETRKKFDEIVAFAEVEKFLDTPVKRYRSGMYVRLAFDQGITVLTSGSPTQFHQLGLHRAVCQVPGNLLNSGGYYLKLLVVEHGNKVTYIHESLASFTIVDIAERKGSWMGREPGVVQPVLRWEVE
jgi:hypothetical protein